MMKKTLFIVIIFSLFACTHSTGSRKPASKSLSNLEALPSNKSCDDLSEILTDMNTNGFAIEKGGKVLWESYDDFHNDKTPHALWSASKTITTTMIGRAVYLGQLEMSTPLTRALKGLYPSRKIAARSNSLVSKMFDIDKDATIEHLVSMSYPYKWNEFYESDISQSTFLPMLYLKGRFNMPKYAIEQPYDDRKTDEEAIQPGFKTIYSGGNSNLLQYILKETYGEKKYKTLPWDLVFDELGMKDTLWERDEAGHFIGSSYAYATPLDMLKYGRFYLNDGKTTSGKRLLSPEWIKAARTIEPSLQTSHTGQEYTTNLGVQSQRVFWLNEPVYRVDLGSRLSGRDGLAQGERVFPAADSDDEREFPNSPADMFFAAGHYGQLIIMLPTDNVVIARTGHDLSYWDNIDKIVSSTLKCFSDKD